MTAGFARYRRVLGAPLVAPTFASIVLARAPIGFYGLAFVLFVERETGSYAIAGGVAAAFIACAGIGSPVQARLLDRFGHRRVLGPSALLHAVALNGLVAATLAGAPAGVLMLVAGAGGAFIPPMSAVMRTLWPKLVGREDGLLAAAFALDGVTTELIFVAGPLVVALITVVLAPQAAVVLGSVLVVAGTVSFLMTTASREWTPQVRPAGGRLLGALGSPGLRTLVYCTLPLGFCFGAVEVALPAFCETHGDRELAGVLLAVWSGSSAAGGLIYGARTSGTALERRYVGFAALLPLGYFPLALAPSIPVMGLLLVPAGLCIAPMLTAGMQLVGEVAAEGTITEAYTWPTTALTVGLGTGNVVAGALAEHVAWESAFLASAVAAVGGLAVARARRGTLVSSG